MYPVLRGKKVLIVDDDVRNVFAITSILELYGLVLMDMMMPEMDGHATMTAIREMPRFARLPIIAVTARAMHGDRDKSLSAGASDYVTKPVDTEGLLACMERWLAPAAAR